MIDEHSIVHIAKCTPRGTPNRDQYNAAGGDFDEDHQVQMTVTDSNSYEAAWRAFAQFGRDVLAVQCMNHFGWQIRAVLKPGSDMIGYYNALPKRVPPPNATPKLLTKRRTYALIDSADILFSMITVRLGVVETELADTLCHGPTMSWRKGDLSFHGRDASLNPKDVRFNRLASIVSGVETFGPIIVAKVLS